MKPQHPPELIAQLAHLPALPGVYQYFDRQKKLLYVGKAKNLKKRVASYFQRSHEGTRIGHMISQIAHLEITVVRSESEALLLEANMIRSLEPRYNIIFRDDKTYPYLKISQERFPRLSYYRGGIDQTHFYFGPYPQAASVKASIVLLQKIFQLRSCEDSVFFHRSRPCLLHQIERCSAPCVQKITEQDYQQDVQDARDFLNGKSQQVLNGLQSRMMQHADQLAFEKAALIRNQIASLSQVLQQQTVELTQALSIDVIAVKVGESKACVTLAMIRGGRHLGDRSYFPNTVGQANAKEVLIAFISQHYWKQALPAQFILSEKLEKQELEALEQLHQQPLYVLYSLPASHKAWLKMAQDNAALSLSRLLSQEGAQQERTRALCDVLGLVEQDVDEVRIECFDVSHSAGQFTQASCVVYQQHRMQAKQYRRFNIEGIQAGDDYAAMKQVLMRRYAPFAKEPSLLNAMPHIVLIDGGKGQVKVAAEVFQSLGLEISLIVGVEKGEHRHIGKEEFVFADGRPKMSLPPDDKALLLVAQIRDEAHRFAITGMRNKRASVRTQGSSLEHIAGIGPQRRAKLLQRFGGVKGVANASVQELASVEGISSHLAQAIYRALRP